MWKKLKWQSVLVVLIAALAIWLSYPPLDIHDNEGNLTKEGTINLGLDLQGGMHLILEVDTSKLSSEEAKDAPERALEVIRNRIDQFGVMEPVIQLQGKNRLLIQLPGVSDRERAKEIIERTAHLEFKLVSEDPELLKKAVAGEVLEGYELKNMKSRDGKTEPLVVESASVLTGDMLVNATTEFSQQGFGQPYVSLEFNAKGADIFALVTSSNIGKRLAVVLDDEISTAPVIRERIPSGRAQITGNFSLQEAKDIALVLRAGALPAPVVIIEERSVGPALGKDSVRKGINAIVIGGICVLAFMAMYYLLAGVIADFALVLNILIITGALAYFGGTLTLPGIAGLLLTIGMAVDANVLIFERIREESRLGKSLRAAIHAGYDKAFWTILDANVTTLITALILFQFGTGPIRGFATTLSIGILASMFTALVVTRLILDIITLTNPKMKSLPMMMFFSQPNIPFVKIRKIAYGVSIIVIIVGMFLFVQRNEKNYGIDFTGGTLQQFKFTEVVPIQKVRKILSDIGLGESAIQQFGQGKEIIIRSLSGKTDEITSGLNKEFSEGSFEIMRIEEVGPTVGMDLRRAAIKALIFAMIGICIYISIRFEFRFAVTAIIALLHDILVSLGMIALTGREISLPVIAALLTIVGYSINDTIVLFDRIREDRKFMRKSSPEEIINTSINQTLSRTVLTSLTTLFVVIALFIFGGKVINDFAFVLLVGIVVGTYSSIFIASPLLIDWPGRKVAKR
ncbi:MAG: protein translocase subunit SecD [Candidatus Omnitrophota bacterium]|nr:protein translocase subunit SecD [Candidatus Omnitrophota bacterium]MBU1895143.1 protein translocase subunit SecD [Candidatus Omnitrophota bacterium]